ncbi:hypothetical protein [Acinetobacter gerneri]|jgi:hypothetical protein|uniref:hypothetical protein n=1 Tax=Acinetobacter gerneri TaxID=202952 RepID=UPI0023F2444F|nr:hypothetical protein [Acinetobacter gerneri]MCH4245394.1 hypothetical protein [Acinetobacter gerneri]
MTNNISILDQFGEDFIKNVRDRVLGIHNKLKKNEMKSHSDIELSKKINSLNEKQKEILDEVVIETVDRILFNFLNFIEQDCQIIYEDKNINKLTDGLAGELYSDDGWIKKYSKFESSEKD